MSSRQSCSKHLEMSKPLSFTQLLVRLWLFALVTLMSLLMAYFARYTLIENASLSTLCDPDPWLAACTIRSLVVQCFIHNRIAMAAIAFALVAVALLAFSQPAATLKSSVKPNQQHFLRASYFCTFSCTLIANCLASFGLVLYCADLAAPALLLSGVALFEIPLEAESNNFDDAKRQATNSSVAATNNRA